MGLRGYSIHCIINLVLVKLLVVLLVVTPSSHAQVRRGSLVVILVSQRLDYIVVGAESRTVDKDGKRLDDSSCKVIALGGDTLFYEGGNSSLDLAKKTSVLSSWSNNNAARVAFKNSQDHSVLNLSTAWGGRALKWFSQLSQEDLSQIAKPPAGLVTTGGFAAVDKSGALASRGANILYDSAKHVLYSSPFDYSPGDVGAWGVATSFIVEFFEGRTARALKAGSVSSRGFNSVSDANLVQKAIRFAMDNAVGEEKEELGGDIDIAILHNNRTIEWVARKRSCYKEDLKPVSSPKQPENVWH